jgi:hypothetical protein
MSGKVYVNVTEGKNVNPGYVRLFAVNHGDGERMKVLDDMWLSIETTDIDGNDTSKEILGLLKDQINDDYRGNGTVPKCSGNPYTKEECDMHRVGDVWFGHEPPGGISLNENGEYKHISHSLCPEHSKMQFDELKAMKS